MPKGRGANARRQSFRQKHPGTRRNNPNAGRGPALLEALYAHEDLGKVRMQTRVVPARVSEDVPKPRRFWSRTRRFFGNLRKGRGRTDGN